MHVFFKATGRFAIELTQFKNESRFKINDFKYVTDGWREAILSNRAWEVFNLHHTGFNYRYYRGNNKVMVDLED